MESGKGGHASLSMTLSYLVLVAAEIERREHHWSFVHRRGNLGTA